MDVTLDDPLIIIFNYFMNKDRISTPQDQMPASESTRPSNSVTKPIGFVPSPEEVASRAYFIYLQAGSLPGHDVQHWLTAESELITERYLTRMNGAHNRKN
jgi:hypothetical protein